MSVFFFKQKTAYEMRISDWSSDVCSSDLLDAPLLHLSANGYRRRNGTFHFEGRGTHNRYGPIELALDGKIDRPKLNLLFARPFDAAQLADVRLQLTPDSDGFVFVVAGASALGPFDGAGRMSLPRGGQAVIGFRSGEHTSELQSLIRLSYAVFCLEQQ